MKNYSHVLTLASLLCLTCAINLNAQTATRPADDRLTKTSISKTKPQLISAEEKLVRSTYEKLAQLNLAAPIEIERSAQLKKEDSMLRFELIDFKVGPIQDIISVRAEDIISPPDGEVVLLTKVTSDKDGDNATVSYKARWTAGQYASGYEPQWTVGNLLSFEANQNYDVGEYASYTVKLRFQGKEKTYKALALFHNAYRFQGELKPTFWDSTVGIGGTLTDVLNENRPISRPEAPMMSFDSVSAEELIEGTANGSELFRAVSGDTPTILGATSGPIVRRKVEDSREHITGLHGQQVGMQGSCFDEAGDQQRCQVGITDTDTYERGTLRNTFFFHVNKTAEKLETATGSRALRIDCYAARGIATSNCLSVGCGINAGLVGSGAEVKMVGGDVWNGEIYLKHSCGGSPVAGQSCTTPSFNGSCPPGSTPNGTGLCCFSGDNSCGSLTFINKCYMYGGDYDFLSCTCFGCDTCGGSPIIIDINGDGIALSGPANGVEFDLNGNGTRDRLGWTLANSDDAWLVLDRDANGNIDTGAELFGDFSPQPAGPNKNGFLALAELDKLTNGGNADGIINLEDSAFADLRLWQDKNHDGRVDAGELHTLASLNVKAFELNFKESKKVDAYGNEFRYKAKVWDTRDGSVGRWAWDVFLSHPDQ